LWNARHGCCELALDQEKEEKLDIKSKRDKATIEQGSSDDDAFLSESKSSWIVTLG